MRYDIRSIKGGCIEDQVTKRELGTYHTTVKEGNSKIEITIIKK